jgi:predicted kinase
MPRHRLVLIEGLPGTGKTPAARALHAALLERGVSSVVYLEAAEDNPIAIGSIASDLGGVIAGYPQRSDVLADWRALAAAPAPGVTILESRFIQNAAMFRALAGGSLLDLITGTRVIADAVRELAPLLVYLRPDDARAHIEQVLREETPQWTARVTAVWEATPWARSRGLAGHDAFVRFFEEWAPQLDALIDCAAFETVRVAAPRTAWPQAIPRLALACCE